MKYTFNNRLLACAFAGAALGLNRKSNLDWDCDHQADNFLEIAGEGSVTLELVFDREENVFFIVTCEKDKDTPTITTLAQVEAALTAVLAELLAPTPEGEEVFRLSDADDGNPFGYTVSIRDDGSMEVGCQYYHKEDGDKLVALAASYLKTGRLPSAKVTFGGEFKVSVADTATKTLAINDGRIQAKHVLALDALRRKHAGPATDPVKVEPVRLFAAPRKARKATRKARKR